MRVISQLLACLLALAGATPVAAQEADERAPGDRVFVLHDSVMLSARDEVSAALADHTVNFIGFGGFLVQAAPQVLADNRHLIDDIVVIELGTNYLGDPAHFRRGVVRTLDHLRDVDQVIWVTPKHYRSGMTEVRAILDEEAWLRPNVELADWTSIAADPATTWFPNDVHLTPVGQARMAALVEAHVRGRGAYDDAPVGRLATRSTRQGLLVKGWTADPDSVGPIDVHIWIDARRVHTRRAGINRPDIEHLGYGTRHGFEYVAAVADGLHTVCVEAVNSSSARTRFIACNVVETDNEPFGAGRVRPLGDGRVEVKGWAMDPDGRRPIGVHVLVDGAFVVGGRADRLRRDVGERFGNGNRHGFRFVLDVGPGPHEVCAHGLNFRAGVANPPVVCQIVEVS